jgi:hypothetical protein
MKQLVVYHGSNAKFNRIDLSKSRNKRDFGRGFYMTTLQEQAEQWANVIFDRYGGSGKYLYKLILELPEGLKVKEFDGLTTQWLEMVKENRTQGGIQHNYDVVVGPIADDRTMPTITLYVNGLISEAAAIEQLRYSEPNNQVSVHTEKALKYLSLLEKVRL